MEIYSIRKSNDFRKWLQVNRPILDFLFEELIKISYRKGIELSDSKESRDDFYRMMYEESNGDVVNPEDYPYFYDISFENGK